MAYLRKKNLSQIRFHDIVKIGKYLFLKGGTLMRAIYEKNKQAIHDIAILLVSILVCFLFFKYLSPIFLPFIIGWLMSLLFNPLADRLQTYKIPRGISALLGILAL